MKKLMETPTSPLAAFGFKVIDPEKHQTGNGKREL